MRHDDRLLVRSFIRKIDLVAHDVTGIVIVIGVDEAPLMAARVDIRFYVNQLSVAKSVVFLFLVTMRVLVNDY